MMRKVYQEGYRRDSSEGGGGVEQEGSEGEEIDEEAWEEEADDLYQWTQKLAFADIR